ncbi:bacteriocin immunity protein [Marinobacter sp. C2H3]|uniref:bacteriocin immunity protein n=1 Tax=Marinobacter sp. C2H3 TaxID=3119003 RepID=UPI00300F57B2
MILIKKKLSDYAEDEFLDALRWFWNEDISEDEESKFVNQFNELVEHPSKSDLIFFPETGREDSPRGIVDEIKRWYHEHGKVCFRDEQSE